MPTSTDKSLLPLIDHALAEPGWLTAIPAALRRDFAAERLLQCRQFNRRLLIIVTLIFDLYWVGEIATAPQILFLSGLLRFAVMTPAVLLFTALDQRGRIGRHYNAWLLLLTIAPCLISSLLYMRVGSPAALPEIHTMPLVLLGTSLAVRMPPREFLINSVLAPLISISALFFCRVLPHNSISLWHYSNSPSQRRHWASIYSWSGATGACFC